MFAAGTDRRLDGAMTKTPVEPLRNSRSENFPVASRLLGAGPRAAVLAFYAYARAADDVADAKGKDAAAKLAALDTFDAGLDGRPGAREALDLRAALSGDVGRIAHARALLGAFRQDARGMRYETWDDLRGYCECSAVPVGRFLLDLHGEDPGARQYSDPLCIALQVFNHLQDLREDRDRLGRVYLPRSWLAAAGAPQTDLSRRALTRPARAVVDRALDECDALLRRAAPLSGSVRSFGLRGQAAATLWLARRLAARLRRGDPLAQRISLSRPDFMRAGLVGLAASLRGAR